MPGGVFIARGVAGIQHDSVVLAHQIATIDRRYLDACIGTVPRSLMARVDEALRLVLNL